MSPGFLSIRALGCALLAVAVCGCGMHQKAAVDEPAPATKNAATSPTEAVDASVPSATLRPAPPQSLERFIAQVRKLSMEARPNRPLPLTIEGSDAKLAAALTAAAVMPSPERFRDVAGEYARIGVNDRAYEYLMMAVSRDPRNAAGYDALARVWRDSGFPQRGLGDAHRAVHFAPSSPIAHNTLGTILQALGWHDAAKAEFERALQLDPSAVYALSNLCYASLVDGRNQDAQAACEKALDVDPRFEPARNNLALTYAAAGNMSAAQRTFAAGDDPALAQYNMGLVHLARHEYREALVSFKTVLTLRPDLRVAAARVRQVERMVLTEEEEE